MKKLLFILLLSPLFSAAQKTPPRFENDTVYTSGGYKIYKGQTLHLANGTSEAGYFRFIKFQTGFGRTDTYNLQNSTILVNKLKNYKRSGADDYNIRILGTVTYKDGSKAEVDIILDVEKTTENYAGLPSELTIPEEFKSKPAETVTTEIKKQSAQDETKKQSVTDEIKKLFDLYKAGALTKAEYEAQKKKILENQ